MGNDNFAGLIVQALQGLITIATVVLSIIGYKKMNGWVKPPVKGQTRKKRKKRKKPINPPS